MKKHKSEKWYFETSGYNHLLKVTDFESFLNTRELQEIRGRELLVSPITLWEIMLTSDNSDFLVFSAQNLFNEKLLATPTEISLYNNYTKAEDYHQNYYENNPNLGYCSFVIGPKIEKFEKVFKDKLKQ